MLSIFLTVYCQSGICVLFSKAGVWGCGVWGCGVWGGVGVVVCTPLPESHVGRGVHVPNLVRQGPHPTPTPLTQPNPLTQTISPLSLGKETEGR